MNNLNNLNKKNNLNVHNKVRNINLVSVCCIIQADNIHPPSLHVEIALSCTMIE